MRRSSLVTLLLLFAAACARDAGEPPTSAAPNLDDPDPRLPLYLAADRRMLTPALRDALESDDSRLRALAYLLVGRLRDPENASLLETGLADPEGAVRGMASFGLSLLEPEAAPRAESTIIGAVAAAFADPMSKHSTPPIPDHRGGEPAELPLHLRALGRVGAADSLPALRVALEARDADVRLAALDALATLASRRIPVSDDFHSILVERLERDPSPAVREGAARALSVLAPPVPAALRAKLRDDLLEILMRPPDDGAPLPSVEPILRALHHAAGDFWRTPIPGASIPTTPSRPFALPIPLLATLAKSHEPDTAREAARLLAAADSSAADRALAEALEAQAERSLRTDAPVEALLPLLNILPVAAPRARVGEISGAARRIHAQLGASQSPTSALGFAHCAAAELVDRGRRWPSRVTACGLGEVPRAHAARLEARILRGVRGEDALRVAYLDRLFEAGPDSVRVAVLDALRSVSAERALPRLLEGLASQDVAVVVSAFRLLLHHRDALVRDGRGPSLHRPLVQAQAHLEELDDPIALAALATALGALPDARHPTLLSGLARHWNATVRERAVLALTRFPDYREGSPSDEPPNKDPRPLPPNPIEERALATRPPHTRFRVEVEGGAAFVMEIDPEAAPVTTLRFQERVQQSFFDGAPFLDRGPGDIVEGGDPRGDGHGVPGHTVRDEPSPSRFERGTVGISHAGPDTGGTQFFITLTDRPELEGRYTPFARIIEGMSVVDALLPGARITTITPLESSSRSRGASARSM